MKLEIRKPSGPTEDSIAIRVVVAVAVEVAILAVVTQPGAVEPLTAVAALLLAPLGYLFSYHRRGQANVILKLVLSVALLAALPADLASACGRGPYDVIQFSQFSGLPAPTASLGCELSSTGGSTTITVRRFPLPQRQLEPGTNLLNLLRYLADSRHIRSGDCKDASPAFGRWAVAGSDTGAVLCYVDGPTGDAIMYWTYDEPNVLVKAVNRRGDMTALYGLFEKYAKFIAPR